MSPTATDHAGPITDPMTWLENNVSVVSQAVNRVARRRRLPPSDRDELLSQVFAHLLKDDCRALRVFRGESSLGAYLAVIAERQFLDLRAARWGKWRPSAEARRQGPAAVRLERLICRDGVDPAQARAMIGGGPAADAPTITRGRRLSRHFVGLDAVRDHGTADPNPLEELLQSHHAVDRARVRRQVATLFAQLCPADRTILRLRHADGLQIAQIARQLRLEPRALYPRLAALHARLRRTLAQAGVTAPCWN